MTPNRKTNLLTIIGPGILVAATGVGAGDLATGAFTGSKLGLAVLWAVVVGAGLKFVLNEGLARWQLATGDTLLEGCVKHLGQPVQFLFLIYLLLWSFVVGSALMSASGVAAHAILPVFEPEAGKIIFGLLHSALAVVMVRLGGYRLFEKVMSVCIAVMFVTVVTTAVLVKPPWAEVASGLVLPSIPDIQGQGLDWTIALMGGVGGTLTVLCYGYWIREEGRQGTEDLKTCRIDLAAGYAMTALFGIGMVILGSKIDIGGKHKPAELVVLLANELETSLGSLGPLGKWAFLIGAWGAIASSLLGVWQSVPYLFADFCNLTRNRKDSATRRPVDTHSLPYRAYLYGLASIPTVGLWLNFETVQKVYAIIGAAFIPMLAAALLILNGRVKLIGSQFRNSILTTIVLVATLVFFVMAGWIKLFPGSWLQFRQLLTQ